MDDSVTERDGRATGPMATDGTNLRSNAAWLEVDQAYRLQTRHTAPIVLARGEGVRLWDVEGNAYLDFHSGQVCANTGHCHPELVEAVTRQLRTLMQTGSMFTDPCQAELARKLAEITPEPLQKSYFICSGSEAVEVSLRAARFYTGRSEVVGLLGSYHGLTMGAAVLGSGANFPRQGYGYTVAGVNFLPPPFCYRCDFNQTYPGCGLECLAYGKRVVEQTTSGFPAAIMIELVVSGGGVYVPPVEWVQALREYCTENGILLIADECLTGIGRTGEWFAFEHFGIVPDIVATSKGLGGGLPLSAAIVTREVAAGLEARGYRQSSSHTGDPLLTAAGLANIEIIERHGMLANVREMGSYLRDGLEDLVRRHEILGEVRGLGLIQGLDFVTDKASRTPAPRLGAEVSHRAAAEGLFVGAPGGKSNVMRILPPFVVTRSDIDTALDVLDRAVATVARESAA